MRGVADFDLRVASAIIALSVAGLTTPSPALRKAIFAPIAALSVYLAFFMASNDLRRDHFVVCWFTINLFRMSDLLLLTDVHKELRRQGDTREISQLPLSARLKWALSLFAASRGVGWSHEPTPNIPPRPTSSTTRTQFILHQIITLGRTYLILSFGRLLGMIYLSFRDDDPPFSSRPWWLPSTVYGLAFQAYAGLNTMYTVCSIIGVAFHLSAPSDWPPYFGSASEAYTVRNQWGRAWHQGLRRLLTAHATALANALRLPRGRVRAYFCLYTSFFISGLIHYVGEYAVRRDWSGVSLVWFSVQACAITFEDAVQGLAGRSTFKIPKAIARFIGYIWVYSWFAFVLPFGLEPLIQVGMVADVGPEGEGVLPALAREILRRLRVKPI